MEPELRQELELKPEFEQELELELELEPRCGKNYWGRNERHASPWSWKAPSDCEATGSSETEPASKTVTSSFSLELEATGLGRTSELATDLSEKEVEGKTKESGRFAVTSAFAVNVWVEMEMDCCC